MEHEGCDQSTQGVLDFKCKKIIPVEKKSSVYPAPGQSAEIVEKNYSVDSVAFPTPEKTAQSSRTKSKVISLPLKAVKQDEGQINQEEAVELPDKYKTIAEFFDRIGSSVRLLRLCKKLPTFQNICTQVEVLTKRKLSYSHLAQIKYMLPEFIQIEKTLVHDEKTLCMKPDLKVTLLLDVVEAHPDQSPFMVLRQVFHSKLLAFFNSNPEDSDIPEATLPILIGQRNETCSLEPLPIESCINSNPAPIELEPLSNLSHLSPCFKIRFSQKVIVPDTEKTQLLASTLPLLPVNSGDGTDQEISLQEKSLEEKSLQEKESSFLDSKTSSSKSHADLIFNPRSSICSSAFEDSPSSVLDPRQVRIATPVQSTPPRRTMPSSDDKIICRTRMSSHTAAKRSLDFLSPLEEGEESASSFIVEESKQDRDNRLKTDPLLSARMQTGAETTTKMSQTVFARKQRMLASLLDLFNLIHRIFQSVKCSSITKQELLHKIILENCDIVETREVEEQLELLEELVPDWICRKLVPSGDLLYSIKKVSDLESIRARLVDAV